MLEIKPIAFKAESLELGPLEQLSLELGERKIGLAVEAAKVDDSIVVVRTFLKLALADGLGMSVTYAVNFECTDSANPEFVVNDELMQVPFIQVNAPAIAYPFLRAYVSTICVNSGVPSVLLPPVNFQAIYSKRKEEGQAVTDRIFIAR